MKIDIIAGARPNFIKIAAIIDAINVKRELGFLIEFRLIHTGQHFDKNMSGNFFSDLGIPEPHFNLNAGGKSQAEQTATIMIGYEKLLLMSSPDVCLVVGDVTSTMACAITAKKLQIAVAHIEAGIRSNDRTMPEEINRLVTDSITDYFFTTTEVASENLLRNGINENAIFFVGNTMIDTLIKNRSRFQRPRIWKELNLINKCYIVLTLHRPANVDQKENLKILLDEIVRNSRNLPLIFPVHPRTASILKNIGIDHPTLHMIEPLGYLEFNFLVENSKAVITDSGGITEETTVMAIPCMTLRDNTERPETIIVGTNELLGTSPDAIKPAFDLLFEGGWKRGNIPNLWDGQTSGRIIEILLNIYKL